MRGMVARGFNSAEDFFQAWPAQRFDLLLLDVALPGASGLEIAQRVRARDNAGIVMLTVWDSNDVHVQGLNAGADVFLSKHSSLEVIEAACRSTLRRLAMKHSGRQETSATFAADAWQLHCKRWVLETPDGSIVTLTHTELVFLAALFETPGISVARKQILELLGKQDTISNQRNLDNAASRLRRKIWQACDSEFPVRPSYGKGYTFTGECRVNV